MKGKTFAYWVCICYILMIFVVPIFSYYDFEEISLNPNDYARITDVEYKAELLDEPGYGNSALITEKITFDVHASSKSNPFWELWRDLPEDYVDGLKVDYEVLSVKRIYDNGEEVYLDESSKLYWEDEDYVDVAGGYGPDKWYHNYGSDYNSPLQDECLMIYIDGVYREKMTYEIQYIMNNPALRYNDCSELYLSMYSDDATKYLKSYKADILIKNEDMPMIGNYEAHTYGTNSNEFPFTESDSKYPGYHTFSFELDEEDLQFKPYNEYIEFDLLAYNEDYDKFTDYAPYNSYSNDNVLDELRIEQFNYDTMPTKYQDLKIIVLLVCIIISIMVLRFAFNIDKKMKAKHKFYEPEMQMDYFREIPSSLDPHFAEELVFCKHKRPKKHEDDGYSAIMLSLVRKGYIEIERINPDRDWRNTNVKIIVKQVKQSIPIYDTIEDILNPVVDEREKLTLAEEHYYNLIVRHATFNEIAMSSLQSKISLDYENTYSFMKNLEKSITTIGTTQGYFQKANYQEPKKKLQAKSTRHMVYGILLLTIVNLISYQTRLDLAFGGFTILGIAYILSSILIERVAHKYVLLTQFGETEYVKWRGLYEFLNSETLMNERTIVELPLWEQYLVYATAFGISDKVIKAINIRCPDMEASTMLRNPYYRSRSFYSSSTYFRHATYSARSSYNSSYYGGGGSFGGSHSYGGGGRGGGGGRRRSLNKKIFRLQV